MTNNDTTESAARITYSRPWKVTTALVLLAFGAILLEAPMFAVGFASIAAASMVMIVLARRPL